MTNFQLLLLLEKFIVNIGETSLQNRQFDITCFSICPRFRNNCFVFCTERNWKVHEKYVKSKKKKKVSRSEPKKRETLNGHWMIDFSLSQKQILQILHFHLFICIQSVCSQTYMELTLLIATDQMRLYLCHLFFQLFQRHKENPRRFNWANSHFSTLQISSLVDKAHKNHNESLTLNSIE